MIATAIILASCSVKEVRDGCPCRLEVDLSDASQDRGQISVRIGSIESSTILYADPASEKVLTVNVPKGHTSVACIQGIRGCINDGNDVIIPEGLEADSLMVSLNDVDCSGEKAYCKAVFHKDWASITVFTKNSASEAYPYDILICGKTNGISLISGMPVEGRFRYRTSCSVSDGTASIRIPRQNPDGKGLTLTLVPKKEGGVGKEYDLSAIISAIGFDWTAKDLDDIRIDIDHSGCLTGIRVIDWNTGEDRDVII